MPSTGLALDRGLEMICEVQVGIPAVDVTPPPPRSARLPAGAICSPGSELSGPSPGEDRCWVGRGT